jgi:hypothetical protein
MRRGECSHLNYVERYILICKKCLHNSLDKSYNKKMNLGHIKMVQVTIEHIMKQFDR